MAVKFCIQSHREPLRRYIGKQKQGPIVVVQTVIGKVIEKVSGGQIARNLNGNPAFK
jgi:hypothetical protein